jgi:hypothetical protein
MLSGQLPPTAPTLELAGFKQDKQSVASVITASPSPGPPAPSRIFRIRDLKQSIL